ncbi:Efg1p [Rhodotorula paludigena]|uniref:Efg1p n=1 Tax=Rhodotorula paludigena TaxID=86838 RepID=UPI0031737233
MAGDHAEGSRGRGRGRGGAAGGRGGSSQRGGAPRGRAGAKQAQGEQPAEIPSGSVSKLKAQLRQTKRLLARDDLTPDVRTTSERRLAILEDELAKAENSKVEKKMVQRYRGVKFFERQKLLRKIKQAKKQLESLLDSKDVQEQLLQARVDLYYVLRYPKTDKYIALFPDGTYVPYSPSAPPSDATPSEQKRHSLRAALRKRIERGEIPPEAELGELGIEGEEDVGSGPAKRARAGADADEDGEGADEEEAEEARPAKKQRKAPLSRQAEPGVAPEADEAFAEEEEEAAAEDAPKKKLNRKERKERKRAEAAAAAGGVEAGAKGASGQTGKDKGAAAAGRDEGKSGKKGGGKKSQAQQLAEEDDFFA